MKMQPYILRGLAASLEAFNRLSGSKLLLAEAPFLGPRMTSSATVEARSEFTLLPHQNVRGLRIVNGTWVGLHHFLREVGEGIRIDDCDVDGALKWLSRSYRMRHCEVAFSSFRNVRDEHGIYWDVAGGGGDSTLPGLVLTNLYLEDIASQGIQLVQRSRTQGFDLSGDMVPGGVVLIRDCLLRNCEFGWEEPGSNARPSFAVSVFGREIISKDEPVHTERVESAENELRVRRVMVDATMQATPHKDGATCHGAFYVGPRPKATLDGCIALMGITDRPVVKVEGVADLTIANGFFHADGGQPTVYLEGCAKVRITNCRGNLRVYDGKSLVGDIQGGYSKG